VNNIFNNDNDEFADHVDGFEDDNTDNYDYNPYDLNEVFGQKPVQIEGDNPFCNVTKF
jgi:hypothetical protein